MSKQENLFEFSRENRHIHIIRYFETTMDELWKYFSEYQSLEEWLAPAPYTLTTKRMLFEPAGSWLYSINSPEGEKHWNKTEYIDIAPMHSIEAMESFCDENGKINRSLPVTKWTTDFEDIDGRSAKVTVAIDFETSEDVDKFRDMDFEAGLTQSFDQLEEILKEKLNDHE